MLSIGSVIIEMARAHRVPRLAAAGIELQKTGVVTQGPVRQRCRQRFAGLHSLEWV